MAFASEASEAGSARLARIIQLLTARLRYHVLPTQEPPLLPPVVHVRLIAPVASFVIVKLLPDFEAATIV
jgi:hypothetical protein